MRKIDWKTSDYSDYTMAELGNVILRCQGIHTFTRKHRWRAIVRIGANTIGSKTGPVRHSLLKAKEDAIRLGREMLLDFHESIIIEMRSFGLDVS